MNGKFAGLRSGLALMLLVGSFCVQAAPVRTIGIVLDGPWAREQDRMKIMQDEILELTRGEFDVRFPAAKLLDGGWTLKGVNRAIDRLLNDPEVDVVLALGVVASAEIARRKVIPKPVMAPVIVGLQPGLPYKNGVSGKHNLNYLHAFNKLGSDLLLLYELSRFKKLAILIDPLTQSVMERYELDKVIGQIPAEVQLVPAGGTPAEVISGISDDTDAVLVLPLLRYDEAQFREISQGLLSRRLPSLSVFVEWEVREAGLLVTTTTDKDLFRLIRRIAINVQRILLGEDPGQIGVDFTETVKPVINMGTANAVGVLASYSLLAGAEVIPDPRQESGGEMKLLDAVQEAVSSNLSLKAAEAVVRVGSHEIDLAKAKLLPSLESSLQGRQIDKDRARASNGTAARYESSANLELSQVLWSERAWANVDIQKLLQESRDEEFQSKLLDLVRDTSVAFLDVLRAKTLVRINRENLGLTISNLDRANVRVKLGAANRSETFRWTSELATGRRDVILARSRERQAKVALNRFLNRDLEAGYRVIEPRLDDSLFLLSDARFLKFIDNPVSVGLLRDFFVDEGLRNSPELRQIQRAMSAQERALLSARRRMYVPEVGFKGSLKERLGKGGAGSNAVPVQTPFGSFDFSQDQDNTDWSAGVSVSLPLFLGGSMRSEVRKANDEVARVQYEWDAAQQGVEAQIRAQVFAAQAAYANINLARQSAESATNNLELVTDAYAQGAISVVELLDAQSAAFNADLASANAEFDFMIELVRLQRATGQYDFLMSAEDREALYQRMQSHFDAAGYVAPPLPVPQ